MFRLHIQLLVVHEHAQSISNCFQQSQNRTPHDYCNKDDNFHALQRKCEEWLLLQTTLVVVNNSSPVSHSVFWHNNPYCPVAYIDLRYIFFQHQCFHVDNNWRYMICKSLVNALSLHSSKYCLTIWF